jgi:hypothetical protein
MKIAQIDKNFAITNEKVVDGARWYTIPHPSFALYGVYFDEKEGFLRMPREIAKTVSPGVTWCAGCTSGGRVRFSTNSKTFALSVRYAELPVMSHMSIEGQCGFVLLEETETGRELVKIMPPVLTDKTGYTASTALKADGEMHDYILYFPLYNEITAVEIALDEDAKIGKGKAYRNVKPILYYGSSITHGGCASRSDNMYPARIERWTNIDFIDLGFSGSARAEDVMVDYLASIDCSVFVCDYDHNAPNPEHLEETHYRLYEKYRAKRPNTPILFVTRPDIENDNSVDKRREIIFGTYQKAKALGDDKVYFLDGGSMFEGEDRAKCTVDGCHPNDLGFEKMAKSIKKKLDIIFKEENLPV